MQIYVNDQELDAELTDERNLEDVYNAVSDWISQHRRYILGLRVNEEEVALSSLKSLETDAVRRLDFYVGDELDMVLTTVDELDRYVDQIGSTLYELDSLNANDIGNLQEGVQWIQQIMSSFSTIMNMDLSAMSVLVPGSQGKEAIDRIMQRLESRAAQFNNQNDRAAIESFLDDLRSFKFFVMKLGLQLRTMNARTEELIELVTEFDDRIPDMVKEIISINESFNAGRDYNALETLKSINEKMNAYLSTIFTLDYKLKNKKIKKMNNI
ncbi:MAG: hypothetical protein KDK27_02375, partial [Leptospiraceae bacterium]|nr:hypothetical protein [Leptospiraceae bacterium]